MATRDIHKVELNVPETVSVIPAMQMKRGQYAKIADFANGQEGRIIGRTWASGPDEERFFALDNPKSTWHDPDFSVRVLRPGEIITIVVGITEDE